jgi:CPA2 family monovalent cation:H+ antiporter-2
MMPDPAFFRDLAWVFAAAVLGGALARLARQPMVIGYVVGGILIGPFTPGPVVGDLHTFELFAEIGVVLLMFSIGIEFSLRDLLRVRSVALLGGPLGIVLSVGLAVGVGYVIGWSALQSVVVGLVVSVASTMVLARLLLDRGELHSRHGRIMIGITLVEDLAVVVLTVLVPVLGTAETERLVSVALALGKALLLIVPVAWIASRVVPPILERVARTRSDELFLLVALAIGLGTAALAQAIGLSLALGAFLAGLTISESDYAHETLARMLSLRDTFVAMFFVTIGALIDPATVVANLPLLGTIIALVVIGKLVIWTAVVWLFGFPATTAILVAVGLTQIGEFSFILVQVARGAGHVGDDVYNATLAASLLTILFNAGLMQVTSSWVGARRVRPAAVAEPPTLPADTGGHVVLCGFGRVGSAIGEALEAFSVEHTVIERDPDTVKTLRARGVACLFGDAGHRGLLEHAGATRAALVVVTLPEIESARRAVSAARVLAPDVPVLARAHRRHEADQLREMGATEVIQPEVEAAATLIRRVLARLALPKARALDYLERFREPLRAAPATESQGPLPDVREVPLPDGALADRSLVEARIRERFGVTVVAIRRADGDIVNPSADTILRAGDQVRLFGLPAQITAFMTEAARPTE